MKQARVAAFDEQREGRSSSLQAIAHCITTIHIFHNAFHSPTISGNIVKASIGVQEQICSKNVQGITIRSVASTLVESTGHS